VTVTNTALFLRITGKKTGQDRRKKKGEKESLFVSHRITASSSPESRSCRAAQMRTVLAVVRSPHLTLRKGDYKKLAGVGRELLHHPL